MIDVEVTPLGFAETYLRPTGSDHDFLADWQARAVLPLSKAKVGQHRVNITVVAPNGSGKDQRIIPSAAYWWLNMYDKGRVVITSKSATQIEKQTQPAIDAYWRQFGWPEPVCSPRYTLRNNKGGELIAMVTNDATRIEGWHERPDSPLLLIVNEAKSVDDAIFVGLDRCTPTAVIYVSSPGGREGKFFKTHDSLPGWIRIKAGLEDCPWIPQSKIDEIIATYGADDPYTRSMLHGEFMKHRDGEYYCLEHEEYDACIDCPPEHVPGFKYAFFDFADGRAENVCCFRNGNKFVIRDAWREKNEDAVVGRCIALLNELGLKPHQAGGDAAAKGILDKMAKAGWNINRQNFGAKTQDNLYRSWSVKAWIEGANKIKRREVIVPRCDTLRAQICTRRKNFMPDGRLALEDKAKMQRERDIDSPDRADALFGAMAQADTTLLVPDYIMKFNQPENAGFQLPGASTGLY